MRKRVVTILTCIALCMSLMPTIVSADSSKTEVSVVRATCNLVTPKYGELVKYPTFEVTQGKEARFDTYNGGWMRNEVRVPANTESHKETFKDGDYYYYTQLRIDGDYGKTHKLSNNVKVYVNGVEWRIGTVNTPAGAGYSAVYVYSPTTTVKEPDNLPFTVDDSFNFSIPQGDAGSEITPLNIAQAINGGKKPYSYSIIMGPTWLTLSDDGVITGKRPSNSREATKFVVRVSDAKGNSKAIYIDVGEVIVQKEISVIRATSDIMTPEEGANVKIPSFTVYEGAPAYFATLNGGWEPGNLRSDKTFGEGDYYYCTQLRIDGKNAQYYDFSSDLKVYVNGVEWSIGYISNYDTYSTVFVQSPVMNDYVMPNMVSFDMNGHGSSVAPQFIESGKKVSYVDVDDIEGYYFTGWCEDPECKTFFDFSTAVTSDITLYAKWTEATANTWINLDEGWIFLDENCEEVTGFKELGGCLYYFDVDGFMATGWFSVDGIWYYAKENGQVARGWLSLDGGWFYFENDGQQCVPGWKLINGSWYYFEDDGSGAGILASGWVYDDAGNYYFDKNGNMVKGWLEISGKWYYFESNGKQCVSGWKKLGSTWYYFDKNNKGYGVMHTGWLNDGGVSYYLNSNGAMATGWIQVDGIWYFMNSDGSMKTGWLQAGSTWYYLNSDGSMATGWKLLGGVWYFFEDNGHMVTGSKDIGGKTYNFDASGHCTNP